MGPAPHERVTRLVFHPSMLLSRTHNNLDRILQGWVLEWAAGRRWISDPDGPVPSSLLYQPALFAVARHVVRPSLIGPLRGQFDTWVDDGMLSTAGAALATTLTALWPRQITRTEVFSLLPAAYPYGGRGGATMYDLLSEHSFPDALWWPTPRSIGEIVEEIGGYAADDEELLLATELLRDRLAPLGNLERRLHTRDLARDAVNTAKLVLL